MRNSLEGKRDFFEGTRSTFQLLGFGPDSILSPASRVSCSELDSIVLAESVAVVRFAILTQPVGARNMGFILRTHSLSFMSKINASRHQITKRGFIVPVQKKHILHISNADSVKGYRVNDYEYELLCKIREFEHLETESETIRFIIREVARLRGLHPGPISETEEK